MANDVGTRGARKGSRFVHLLFDISVISKGVDGVLEVVGGVLLFFISPAQIQGVVRRITQHELSTDPHDLVARYFLNSAQHLTPSAQQFAAIYLLWHGIVKVVLVTGLLLKRRWAYPLAMAAFSLFLVYQLYRYSHTHAPELLWLSALDVVVIVLTYLEYRRLRTAHIFA
ncbi:MAG: DUF2127 domain-containing protein [Gemmatimonadota bacterium]